MAFQGIDLFDTDALLTEEERSVRDTVRRWVDEAVMPIIAEHYLDGRFPSHLIPAMAELGMLGANLPAAYGCAELNSVAYGLIMQELERGDSGLRSCVSVQSGLVMYPSGHARNTTADLAGILQRIHELLQHHPGDSSTWVASVMELCDYISVLDFGKLLVEGIPAEIQNDETVINAYLGTEDIISGQTSS